MKGTIGFLAALSLVAALVDAQPTALGVTTGLAFELASGKAAVEASDLTVRLAVDFSSLTMGTEPVRLDLASLAQTASHSFLVQGQNTPTLWYRQPVTSRTTKRDINRVGLLSEQFRIDGILHMKRMTEPKTRYEVTHSSYYGGYVAALKGYFTTGGRWNDGDPFLINDIAHPLTGSITSHVYMNHDRRCSAVGFGDPGYWSCLRRATIYAVIASVNWEWNPILSESALGHVGKFHTYANGRYRGEGGWTDFVMTPFGGLGISLMGDIARAKLWPTLDRHLSGNIAARILKTIVKITTDPGAVANAAFNLNFSDAFSSHLPAGRRY
jgi:hypothetical protein